MLWSLLLAYPANVGGVSFSVVFVACFVVVGGVFGVLGRIYHRGGGVCTVRAHFQ